LYLDSSERKNIFASFENLMSIKLNVKYIDSKYNRKIDHTIAWALRGPISLPSF
jgi:hypothetical protein